MPRPFSRQSRLQILPMRLYSYYERIKHVKDWIKEHWEPHECCYDLQLEEEIVPASDSVEVIR